MRKPNKYWTFEKCKEVALMCVSKFEFREKYISAYNVSLKNKWIDEICSHMISLKRKNGYWKNKSNCLSAALECKTPKELKIKYSGAYDSCRINNWLDEATQHMNKLNRNNKIWIIYVYIFVIDENKYSYVGLTCNSKERKDSHLKYDKCSAVNEFINKNNIKIENIIYKIECENILDENVAKNLEKKYENIYENNGYIKINKVKTGNLGGGILIWTKEKCFEAAKSCKSRSEFCRKFGRAYDNCLRNKWLDDACDHMISLYKPKNYWNYEHCSEVSKECESRKEFRIKYSGAYYSAIKHGWIDSICSHMSKFIKRKYLTKEKCFELAGNCKTKKEFRTKYSSAYSVAKKNYWIDEINKNLMGAGQRPNGYWNYEHCKEAAKECRNRKAFGLKYRWAYDLSRLNGWIDEFYPKNK